MTASCTLPVLATVPLFGPMKPFLAPILPAPRTSKESRRGGAYGRGGGDADGRGAGGAPWRHRLSGGAGVEGGERERKCQSLYLSEGELLMGFVGLVWEASLVMCPPPVTDFWRRTPNNVHLIKMSAFVNLFSKAQGCKSLL